MNPSWNLHLLSQIDKETFKVLLVMASIYFHFIYIIKIIKLCKYGQIVDNCIKIIIFLLIFSAGLIAGIVITICMFLLALLYYRNPNKRACLQSCFNFCNSRRGNGRVQYCRVHDILNVIYDM